MGSSKDKAEENGRYLGKHSIPYNHKNDIFYVQFIYFYYKEKTSAQKIHIESDQLDAIQVEFWSIRPVQY